MDKLVTIDVRENVRTWLRQLDHCFQAAGALNGSDTHFERKIERHFSVRPYKYDPVPKRDERFPDPYNMGVNAEVFLYDPDAP